MMEVIIVAIIFTLLYSIFRIIQAFILLCKALYYSILPNNKRLDEAYFKHVVGPTKEYKEFENNFDKNYNNFINPK